MHAWCTVQDGKLTETRRMLSGFSAGITEAILIVTPFEVVKIRLQSQKGTSKATMNYKVRKLPVESALTLRRNYMAKAGQTASAGFG